MLKTSYELIKRSAISLIVLSIINIVLPAWAQMDMMSAVTPVPDYRSPKDGSTIDLSNEPSLTFRWDRTPIPAGGRAAYRFTLYKGFGGEVIIREDLDDDTFSIDVPADKFEDGATYSWQVKQRDAQTFNWNRDYYWSFNVIKK